MLQAMAGLTRRSALGALGLPLLRSADKRPNLLFLIADDHAGYAWGADGDRLASTPNLDRLAGEGVRFARHFCNSPVCTPSRQSLLTGQLPHSAGVTRLPTPLDRNKPTLARQFQKAGYTTAVFGKMHFQTKGEPGLHGFDHCFTEDVLTAAWNLQTKPRPLPAGTRVKPPWKPFQDPARIWLNAERLPFGRYEEDMRASFQVHQAARFLEEHRREPFALWVSFLEPHSPYDFPFEDRERFSPSQFTPFRPGPEDLWQIPLVFRDLTDADKQGIAAAYYTSVQFVDRNVGRVLAKLAELGLSEDTLVVYTADHGYHIGQHGRFEKHCGFDQALRVPLLVRWPRAVRPRVVNALTEHVDLTATITDLCGLEPLPVSHGHTLRPLLEGGRGGRDFIFSEYLENEEAYIRSDRWKLIYCTAQRDRDDGYRIENPPRTRYVRLYDLHRDPGEMHDAAQRHPEIVAGLKGRMLERFRATHPESAGAPGGAGVDQQLDFFLRPRDV
jgi:arylsulfatase A-like enzyme